MKHWTQEPQEQSLHKALSNPATESDNDIPIKKIVYHREKPQTKRKTNSMKYNKCI